MNSIQLKDLHGESNQCKVQRQAIKNGLDVFENNDRARFSMACGTGKTFTQLKLTEELLSLAPAGPKRVVVFVPTLELVRQSRREWMEQSVQNPLWGNQLNSICICSDQSLKDANGKNGKNGKKSQNRNETDEIEFSKEDLLELGIPDGAGVSDNEIRNEEELRLIEHLTSREKADPNAVTVIFTPTAVKPRLFRAGI